MRERELNSAGRIADYFIESKLTPVFVLFCLAVGWIAATLTPREENPQILVPGAEVLYALPGRSAADVDRLVAAPVERALREIEGVDHTYATAMQGQALVAVQFHVGVDKEKAMVRVYQQIGSVQALLPPEVAPPLIRRVDTDDIAVVTVTLASERYDDYALRRLAERVAERLNSIPSVSRVELHGGVSREIRVEPDPARLEAFGLTLSEGLAALAAGNTAAEVGDTVHAGRTLRVQLRGELQSADEVRMLAVGVHRGRVIYVDDVATVHDGPAQERESQVRLGFGAGDARFGQVAGEMPAVTISVAKKPGTNAVTMAREVLAAVETLRQQFIPADVHVVTTRDDGAKANDTVNHLLRDLAVAISAVILTLLPFLGLRAGLIISFVLPLILCLTLMVDLLTSHTVNRISLFAMILSLGMIVDDSIVVLENIYRNYQHRSDVDSRRQAVLAVNEIGPPTTIATFSVVLVFASLNLLTGMNGAYFEPIAFNVQITMALSLLLAYMIVPWACHRWLRGHVHSHAHEDASSASHHRYFKVLTPLLHDHRRRRTFYALTALALLAALMQPAWQFIRPAGVGGPPSAGSVMVAIMPKEDRSHFSITLDMPEGTPIERTDEVVRRLGALLRGQPLVANWVSYVGLPPVVDFAGQIRGAANRQAAHLAEITVMLVHKKARKTTSSAVIAELRAAAAPLRTDYPGLEITLRDVPPGPPSVATVVAEIYGEDAGVRRQLVAQVRERFEATWGVVDVYDSEPVDAPRIDLQVDHEKAMLSGVTAAAVEETLRSLLDTRVLSEARIEGERAPVPILVQVPRGHDLDPRRLDRVYVVNAQGQRIPVSEVVKPVQTHVDRPILRKDNEPYSFVAADAAGSAAGYIILEMNHHLDGLELSGGKVLRTGNLGLKAQAPSSLDGYQLLWDGELRVTLDALGEMGMILIAGLSLIYLLLVAVYRSFVLATLAMTAVPLGFIGVFPGHWLLGIDFSMGSAIGVVALAGVVIRNSLLIIDFIRDYQRAGHPLEEAVKLAGAVRFRPIMLSALTVALGTLILYTDPMFAGLATSLIFGTVTSTGLTLLILPTMYYGIATTHPGWLPGIVLNSTANVQGDELQS
ncbi:efflux RND transporter permease subunit [Panacagrimonas sp.]|uniref:efflux RND transporter permease subunit n=1 Tax=Panacagrimonas sp. TaxID=2480088 RepID=UPI003B5225A9